MNEVRLSWEKIHEDSSALIKKLHSRSHQFEGIIAVTRGGMVPGTLVAYGLNLSLVETIGVTSYDDNTAKEEVTLLKSPTLQGTGKGWLVVDDLVDSGRTFEFVRGIYPDATYACLYAKPLGIGTTDYYVEDTPQDAWIVFPWEESSD